MALFEKSSNNVLDDTEVMTSHIETTRTIDGHTEYVIKLQRGPLPENSWRICKRYNDFVQLQSSLAALDINLTLPPKKFIGNMEPDFIAQRQVALQAYLSSILSNPILAASLLVKKFLDPDNYSTPFQEIALQQVSLALCSDGDFEVIKVITELGWRLRKHYFSVKRKQDPKQELLLSWVDFGPDKYLQFKDMQVVLKSMRNLKHACIEPIIYNHVSDFGVLTIRNFHPDGTLRDILSQSKPKQSFVKKYGNPKQFKSLTLMEVANFGYNILEALAFLHEKGLPYGHLHSGNVLLTSNGAKLLDIENALLGVPFFYRPFVLRKRKLQTMAQIDIYAFGHVLFEMAFGKPLLEPTLQNVEMPQCDANLQNLLNILLSYEALKQDLPTAQQLMLHAFFNSPRKCRESNAVSMGKPYFKLSHHVRDALIEATTKTELRLKNEQKMVRHQKRLLKVQEIMNNEDELKRRKFKSVKDSGLDQDHNSMNDSKLVNGKSPERSDSPMSTSTATSVGTLTPPSHGFTDARSRELKSATTQSPAPPPPPPMSLPISPSSNSLTASNAPELNDRSALLGSIASFNKASLRRVANGSNN